MSQHPSLPRDRREAPRFAYEIEVTVQSKSGLVRGLTRDVGAGGLFIKTAEPAPLSAPVRLVVGGWDDSPISFGGEVRHILPPSTASDARPAGMGISINDIDDEMLGRWIRLVAQVAQRIDDRLRDSQRRSDGTDPAKLARRYARHRVQLAVRVHEISKGFDFVSRNVSAGGIFVECDVGIEPGRSVTVSLRNRVTLVTLTIPGRVVRTNPDGLGIEFELPQDAREELHGFLVSGMPIGSL